MYIGVGLLETSYFLLLALGSDRRVTSRRICLPCFIHSGGDIVIARRKTCLPPSCVAKGRKHTFANAIS